MKCLLCQTDNKENTKTCRKCGTDLSVEPMWQPTWKWHFKTLSIIYVVLVILYFGISNFLSRVPEPYRMRDIPQEVTPWLKK
jgi:hypothetical protein